MLSTLLNLRLLCQAAFLFVIQWFGYTDISQSKMFSEFANSGLDGQYWNVLSINDYNA